MTNPSDTIRAGIIGCGKIACGKHIPGLKKAGIEIVAYCDIDIEQARLAMSIAKDYGHNIDNAKIYTNYKELLEDKSIDIVHVLTPNRMHCQISVDALEAGKHVMCEKPMAITGAEAVKMTETARRTGKILTIGFQDRFSAPHMYLKYAADNGVFGDIYMAETYAMRRAVPNWGVFLDEKEQGGGPLIDIAPHAIDATLWIMNNYKPKYCVGNTYHKLNDLPPDMQGNGDWGIWDPERFKVEDTALGFVTMENGATIMVYSTWVLNRRHFPPFSCNLYGTKAGSDRFSKRDPLRFNGARNGELYVDEIDLSAGSEALLAANPTGETWYSNWADAIKNNKDALVKPEEACVVTQIIEGIYTSAKTGDIYRF